MDIKIEELTKDLIVDVYHLGRFTIATLKKTPTGDVILATGVSRKSYLDKYNQETGNKIAIGRAKKSYWLKTNKKPIRDVMMG